MIERKDFFCPACGKGFDIPVKWVSPCCGTEMNGGDDYTCPECKQVFMEDYEIPACPHCGNIGDYANSQPDHWDCHSKCIEWWEERKNHG
jgi:hypothetical protein